jgi:peptidyl-prolyl cis-trans isomerase D
MGMMHWMRRSSRYFLIAVVVTFVASLAYFGATQDGQQGTPWVARVDGQEIPASAYQRAHRALVEQYRQAFRERLTDDLLRSLRVQEQVVERLVTDRVLQARAAAEGVRVGDAELTAQITRMAAFQEGGRFSRERYLALLQRAQLTPQAFEDDLRSDLLRQRLQLLVQEGVKVSEAEARQFWEGERQRVRVAYLLVPPPAPDEAAPLPEADLEAYYQAHPAEFTRPERRRILVAVLPTAAVTAPPVTDADVETAYRERRAQFEQPARVRLAHILVRVPAVGGSEAEDQARARAEAALQKVRGGADFAQVAKEVSEDPGSAARGGELGAVGPGELVAELDRVIFGLKKGELAGPVRSPFGFHVVRVLETLPGSKRELREVAPTLRATLAAEGHLRALRDRAQEVHRALLAAADFAAEARTRGLTVREAGPLARTDAVEGIGRVAEATEAIFGLAPDGVSAPVKIPEGYAVFRLLETQPSALPPLADVRGDVARAVRRQKAREAGEARARALADALRQGQEPGAVARREGVTAGEAGPFSRAEPPADPELGTVLAGPALGTPEGGVTGPLASPRGFYVAKVVSRERPDPNGFQAARADVERRLLAQKQAQAWQAWVGAARAAARVEINRTVLPEG